jgi:4-carboxymuconolactone decarboxylase
MAADRPGAERQTAGAERRRKAQGAKADGLQAALEALDPDMGRWADEFVFGEVWAGEALGQRERTLVAIAMLAATTRRNQLKNYLHGALQNGIDAVELREVIKMVTVYAGFPAAIEAMLELDSAIAVHQRAR